MEERFIPAVTFRARVAQAKTIVLEPGPVAVWYWHALRAAGLPMVCLHAPHTAAVLVDGLGGEREAC